MLTTIISNRTFDIAPGALDHLLSILSGIQIKGR
jgi:hypothetical protein